MGCGVFQWGVQNLKDFCLRINILKGNYFILRIGLMGEGVQKCQNLTLKVIFLCQKVSEFFSFFVINIF